MVGEIRVAQRFPGCRLFECDIEIKSRFRFVPVVFVVFRRVLGFVHAVRSVVVAGVRGGPRETRD